LYSLTLIIEIITTRFWAKISYQTYNSNTMTGLDVLTTSKIKQWIDGNYDAETKSLIQNLIDTQNETELADSFYKDLEFGTGGLRGIIGVGSNKMNRYTVGTATQGLANYLIKTFPDEPISIAIAHDSRNMSPEFAQIVADVFSANGIKAFMFKELRPTPTLSFAVRALGCKSGVVITASHNPREYNGYKAYWTDGSQVVPPHDKNVIDEVNAITNIDQVNLVGNPDLIFGYNSSKQYKSFGN
jgi:phosphoglucomutase